MANDYGRRIVTLQPQGPVHLLGWSVGGILAQAMAVRLHEIGREVGELVLLDAYPSECWRTEPEPDPIAALRALLAIAGHDGLVVNPIEIERGGATYTFDTLRALPQDRPTLHGPQTARVVGIANAAVTPNREHQVRIQFGWQRGSTPNPGGLTDTGSAQPGHAPGDHTSGSWVAVAEWVAGPNWGTSFLPRVGREVLGEFLHGEI
ncbi:hypothetical protein G6F62_014232 [Rhizopus arrhizus]|nr:hypothetical protein G6F62_014232 [Rhizopus arrhizus]